MYMTENEIVREYRSAKDKRHEIEILADLNATTADEIKKILKANGVDLRGGSFRPRKAAAICINDDFEDEVQKMIKKSKTEKTVIEPADPVPGETAFNNDFASAAIVPIQESKPPLGLTPRDIAESMFNESRIRDIVAAMNRYYEADKAIPVEWCAELKERL